jgi:hypothetical protein
MKYLIYLLLLLSFPAWSLTHHQFVKLTKPQKIEYLSIHIKFLKDVHTATPTDIVGKTPLENWGSLIAQAYADTGFDCFYAGWPSKTVTSGDRKLCSSPATHNPNYGSSQTTCAANELKCQPLLFGAQLCAKASTPTERNSAFAQCETLSKASGKTLEEIAADISSPEKGQQFNELFALVDEICETGMQATKPMCSNLKQKVAAFRALNLNLGGGSAGANRELVSVVGSVTDLGATVNSTLTALNNCLPNTTVTNVTPPLRVPDPIPNQISRDPSSTPFPRITREVDARCGRSRSANGYSVLSVFNCSQSNNDRSEYPAGFSFRSGDGHPLIDHLVSPYEDSGKPYRQIEMESANHGLNETFLSLIDSAGGPDSHDVKSMVFLLPRRTVPRVETIGEVIRMTLPTGETVDLDRRSNAILGGALREGAQDLNTNRHQRTPPNVHYQGTGISVRLDHRFEYPTQGAAEAIVTQGTKRCRVPRPRLFDTEGDLISRSDTEFLATINRACQNQFSL